MSKNIIKALDGEIIKLYELYEIENNPCVEKVINLNYSNKWNKEAYLIDLKQDDSILVFA